MALWGESRPKAYVCYLCGAQFGSSSLHIHLPQCAANHEQRQQQLPPHARKPAPAPPAALPASADGLPRGRAEVEAFNSAMFAAYNEASLTRCGGCGRTFNPEAYLRHAGICKGAASGATATVAAASGGGSGAPRQPRAGAASPAAAHKAGRPAPAAGPVASAGPGSLPRGNGSSSSSGSVGVGGSGSGGGAAAGGGPFGFSRPRALVCYLCGRGFGSASLLIHVLQCEQLWAEREAAAAAPGARARRPPPRPAALGGALPRDAAGIDAFNAQMMGLFNCVSLVACGFCGRTFLPEALSHHAKHCTADAPMAAGGARRGGAGAAGAGRAPAAAGVAGGVGGGGCGSGQEQELEGEEGERIPCALCGRRFGPAAHAKHSRVCAKVFDGGKAPAAGRRP